MVSVDQFSYLPALSLISILRFLRPAHLPTDSNAAVVLFATTFRRITSVAYCCNLSFSIIPERNKLEQGETKTRKQNRVHPPYLTIDQKLKSFSIWNYFSSYFPYFLSFLKYLYRVKFGKITSLSKFEVMHDMGNPFGWKFHYMIKYNIMRHEKFFTQDILEYIRISCDMYLSTFGIIRASMVHAMDSETLWSRHFGAELTAVYTLKLALRAANKHRVRQHLFYLRGFIWQVERMTFVATFDHNFYNHFILFSMYECSVLFHKYVFK